MAPGYCRVQRNPGEMGTEGGAFGAHGVVGVVETNVVLSKQRQMWRTNARLTRGVFSSSQQVALVCDVSSRSANTRVTMWEVSATKTL